MDVLQLDVSGRPQAWISPKEAAVLFTAAAVAAPFLGPVGFVPVLGAGVLSVLFLLFAPASLSEPALGSVAPKNERGDPEA